MQQAQVSITIPTVFAFIKPSKSRYAQNCRWQLAWVSTAFLRLRGRGGLRGERGTLICAARSCRWRTPPWSSSCSSSALSPSGKAAALPASNACTTNTQRSPRLAHGISCRQGRVWQNNDRKRLHHQEALPKNMTRGRQVRRGRAITTRAKMGFWGGVGRVPAGLLACPTP